MAFNTAPEIYLNLGVFFVSQLETSNILESAQGEPVKRRADTDTLWSVCPAHKDPLSSASLRGPGSITVDCARVNLWPSRSRAASPRPSERA